MTIKGVGEVTALTWVLEVGDPTRFSATGQAISYSPVSPSDWLCVFSFFEAQN